MPQVMPNNTQLNNSRLLQIKVHGSSLATSRYNSIDITGILFQVTHIIYKTQQSCLFHII